MNTDKFRVDGSMGPDEGYIPVDVQRRPHYHGRPDPAGKKRHDLRSKDDWELVALCRQKHNRCFDILIERHLTLVVNLCYRFLLDQELAREAAQEIFLKAYESIDSLQYCGRPFVHWLCRIASNHCRNLYRRSRREKEILQCDVIESWYGDSPFEGNSYANLENMETSALVRKALKLLQYDERSAIVLWILTGMGSKEMAEVFRIPQYLLRRRLRRAVKKMRRTFLQEERKEYASIR